MRDPSPSVARAPDSGLVIVNLCNRTVNSSGVLYKALPGWRSTWPRRLQHTKP